MLLGRSGSGKSTLLRILARLDAEFEGELRVPERPSVAFQDSRLLPWNRVIDNVTLGLTDRDAKRRAAELVDIVKDCIRRHTQLQSRLLEAGPLFRAEQDRKAYQRYYSATWG